MFCHEESVDVFQAFVGACRDLLGVCQDLLGLVGTCRDLSGVCQDLLGVCGECGFLWNLTLRELQLWLINFSRIPIPKILWSVPVLHYCAYCRLLLHDKIQPIALKYKGNAIPLEYSGCAVHA